MPVVIEGGRRLQGEVEVDGAKNAALPIIAATLLTSDDCLIENVPFIEDIRNMIKVLHHHGVAARFEGHNTLRIKATRIATSKLPVDLARAMRASFLIAGPLLARFGQVEAPHPGGCAIGKRPVTVDLKGFQAMGAEITPTHEGYVVQSPRLRGTHIVLDYPSHTGTENLLMAAVLADGVTHIENASIEPEVVDLAGFLSAMGARIAGAGTSTITVEGTRRLHGAAFRVMPDRMVAGTYALAAAITGGMVKLPGEVSQYLGAFTTKLRAAGVDVEVSSDHYLVSASRELRAVDVQTYPYPGFPTDLQAPFTTLLTQAQGRSSVYETMFDGRLRYVEQLRAMGARIDVSGSGRIAMVHGPTRLYGARIDALDIRSGAAMVLAGLAAEGETQIGNVTYIDRGYQDLDARLRQLGAHVTRVEEQEHRCPTQDAPDPLEWLPLAQD
ncbi:MAG: UDP-N-acetylglucosamine 1-carboxyvinyltransferase [Anaerolineae bacterium]